VAKSWFLFFSYQKDARSNNHQKYSYTSTPYGPYGLYRASVPVQYSYTSTPTVGRTVCAESQCLYSTAKTLLPLWVVRPVEKLSARTVDL